MSEEALGAALRELWQAEPPPERSGDDDVLGVLVRMMLAQATSKPNAAQAFGNLLDRFGGDWAAVAAAAESEVVEAIAVGGLARQKAPRVQAVLRRAHAEFGDYSLEGLRRWEAQRALDWVSALVDVGPTTARFALMFAAGADLMPINGGIRRVLERLGVVDAAASAAQAHAIVDALLPPGAAYAAHMTLVDHARKTCRTAPECATCPVTTCPRIGVAPAHRS